MGKQHATWTLKVTNCLIDQNTASEGAGIWIDRTALDLLNSGVVRNIATGTNPRGGAIRIAGPELAEITNCTIADNTAPNFDIINTSSGAGIGLFQAAATIRNCIIWGNTDASGGSFGTQLRHVASSSTTTTIRYTDIQFGQPGIHTTNIERLDYGPPQGEQGATNIGAAPAPPGGISPDDPRFVSSTSGNYRLNNQSQPISPCIDRGDSPNVPLDTFDVDGDGDIMERTPDLDFRVRVRDDPRVPNPTDPSLGIPLPEDFCRIVDLGAFEFVPEPEDGILVEGEGNRYLKVTLDTGTRSVALWVGGSACNDNVNCIGKWAQAPREDPNQIPYSVTYSPLGDNPVYKTMGLGVDQWGTVVHIGDKEIMPGTSYTVEAYDQADPSSPFASVSISMPIFGDVDGTNVVDVDDITCVLAAFAGCYFGCPTCYEFCTCPGAPGSTCAWQCDPEIPPDPEILCPCDCNCTGCACSNNAHDINTYPDESGDFSCLPSHHIDVDDLIVVLDAFGGANYEGYNPGCSDFCVGGRGQRAFARSASSAEMTIMPQAESIGPADAIAVDIFVESTGNIRAYQLAFDTVGPAGELLPLLGFLVAESRPDHVLHAGTVHSAVDVERSRVVVVRRQPSAPPSERGAGPAYLGTAFFAAPASASGSIVIELRTEDTLLRDASGAPLDWALPNPGKPLAIGR